MFYLVVFFQSKIGKNRKVDFVEDMVLLDQVSNIKVSEEKPPSPMLRSGLHEKFDVKSMRHRDLFLNRYTFIYKTGDGIASKKLF